MFKRNAMVKKTSEVTARNVTTTSSEASHIAGNTQIIFTMKSFLSLMGTMIGLFFGFYLLVVTPRIDKAEKHYEEMHKEQKELNQVFTKEINDIKLEIRGSSQVVSNQPQQTAPITKN